MTADTPEPQEALEAVLAELAVLRQRVAALEASQALAAAGDDGDADGKGGGYVPVLAPRWWRLDPGERRDEVARLRSWVETVFRPGYGHLAARVGPCWEEHDLCLYQLAWLSEIHAVIFQSPQRLLTSEADWHVRLLPAAVALMAEETGSCDHLHQETGAGDPWAVRT